MRTISLFSGAGGFDVGASIAGFEIVWANDFSKHAVSTYRKNLGDHIVHGDIDDLMEEIGELKDIDAVIGGPPCQGFSVAGKMDLDDPRSKMVNSFMKVVDSVRPKLFIMENVKSLATLVKFEDVRNQLFKLAIGMGYKIDLILLNSKDFNCPTSRERMFFVGLRGGNVEFVRNYLDQMKTEEIPSSTIFDKLGPVGTDKNPSTCNAGVTLAINPVLRKSPYSGMLFNGLGRPINPNRPAQTLPASMGGNKTPIVDENQIYNGGDSWVEKYHEHLVNGGESYDWKSAPKYLRRLTIEEAKLLQTFPEDFDFQGPKTSIYSQIGNAVPCNLSFAISQSVKLSSECNGTEFEVEQPAFAF